MKGEFMKEKYNKVPNILTGKDLDYLSDMFTWNYGALKKANLAHENISDDNLKETIEKAYNLFDDNLNLVLTILQEQGGQNGE